MITQTLVGEDQREDFLPKHMGKYSLMFELYAFSMMDRYAENYTGGLWDFFELSNGGMFIAPSSEDKFHMANAINHSDEIMTAQAAGIGITLYALNALAINFEAPEMGTLYYALKNFAAEHPESRSIFRFID